jgi:hypothetical protein
MQSGTARSGKMCTVAQSAQLDRALLCRAMFNSSFLSPPGRWQLHPEAHAMRDALLLVKKLTPKSFLLENVLGITDIAPNEDKSALDLLVEDFSSRLPAEWICD